MKQYENLSIRDHFMFGKICQDINNSQLILSALLNRNVILTNSGVEHYMQEYSTSKFIRHVRIYREGKGHWQNTPASK